MASLANIEKELSDLEDESKGNLQKESSLRKGCRCLSLRSSLNHQLWSNSVKMITSFVRVLRSPKTTRRNVKKKHVGSTKDSPEAAGNDLEVHPSPNIANHRIATSMKTLITPPNSSPSSPIYGKVSPSKKRALETSPSGFAITTLFHKLQSSETSVPIQPNLKHMRHVRSKRLLKEFHDLNKEQRNSKEPIFAVELVNDNLYEWKVKLYQIDPDSELARDMVEFNIPYILLNISFPENFPFQPPFLRVLAPKLEKGFVMEGGAICMELLTPRGWASAYTIEAILMQFASSVVKGQGRVCRKRKGFKEFNKKSAEASFKSLVKTHDKYGWVTPPIAEG